MTNGGKMDRKTGLIIYSLGHLLVDGACCLVVLSSVMAGKDNGEVPLLAVVLYNTLAFALQPLFGLFADKKGQ